MGSGSAQHVWYSALDMCGGPGCPPPTGWETQKTIAGSQTTATPALSQLGLLDINFVERAEAARRFHLLFLLEWLGICRIA
jgi:hypothetical protein